MSSPPTRRCSPSTASSSPSSPRRRASRSISKRRWPAASRSSRRCARRSPPTRCKRVYGILNGTCNYILTKMQDEHRSFADVLEEAQELGYAEADPTFDIGGFDTAHKLAILTSLAFGTELALRRRSTSRASSRSRRPTSRRQRIWAIASSCSALRCTHRKRHRGARAPGHGAGGVGDRAKCRASPTAVAIDADFCGSLLLVGPGAGARATASAVASDILDIARGAVMPPFVIPHAAP